MLKKATEQTIDNELNRLSTLYKEDKLIRVYIEDVRSKMLLNSLNLATKNDIVYSIKELNNVIIHRKEINL
ncbi:MAG: hypothetical protein II013_07830 [Lachnobacterium sp.]|nr:hypothetical protein [Lachnobacterium sp.]